MLLVSFSYMIMFSCVGKVGSFVVEYVVLYFVSKGEGEMGVVR